MSIGEFEEPVLSRNQRAFFHHFLFISPIDILSSQSTGNLNFELETGGIDDTLYYSDVKEVICTKRISL